MKRVIRRHQASSGVIRRHQASSEFIGGHQRSSVAISGYRWPLVIITSRIWDRNQWSSPRGFGIAISGHHLEDLGAPFDVGLIDHHLPVKPARSEERRVEHIDAVGAREHHDT